MSSKRKRSDQNNSHHSEKRQHVERRKAYKIEDFKQNLRSYLVSYTNITDQDEFWKFYDKYKIIGNRSSNQEKLKILNIAFEKTQKELYDRLPMLTADDKWIPFGDDEFNNFLIAVKVYQDFQQKTNFNKLKKIKMAQSDLPIAKHKNEIAENIQKHKILLIAGDTGCGKSTQVPQYILEAGFNKIVCTQPRRIACISLAKRVSHETLTQFKNTVGYQIRFEKTKRSTTNIIFMTEGLLLRQASEVETLNSYDVFILDEVHERHLHGDFLIGVMKCLLQKNVNFKLIIMSATMNMKLFKDYFEEEDLYIIQVPGRLYPIEIQYHPIVKDPFERKREKFDSRPYLKIIQMIDNKYPSNQKGDMLIFLNGFSEIAALTDAVKEYAEIKQNWIVLPLHSSLSLEDQDKVFDYPPEGIRKCVISTNIAETSITIDGIRFVMDSGKVNRMMYTENGINKLTESNISQDSARQRSGRAGRTGPGISYRMYSEEEFKDFDPFTPAEIHLVPLDSLILQMASLGLNDISHFPFLEPPSMKSLSESIEKLKSVGAIETNEDGFALTQLGDALSQLPVEIHIGKMLIMSTIFDNLNAVLILASLLSVQSPLTQNAYRNIDADNLRKPLESNHGDPLTLFNFFKEWLSIKQNSTPSKHNSRGSRESSKVWAKKRCLEEQRFYEVTKLSEQFRNILREADLISEISKKEMSAGERAIRKGEVKLLKSLQYQLKNENKSQKRKFLKYRTHEFEDQEDDRSHTDIRDVEFRLSNDLSRVEELLNDIAVDSYEDVIILKLILTNSFYPQIAVEDEFNSSKTVSEKLYHAKTKNFVSLKPMSYFASNPEVLELHVDDIDEPPLGYFSKKPLSKKHQVLVYQSILETKKVYLVNTMRMPAIQTMFLFAKKIATNSTLTKFVFDDFLLFHAPLFGQGKSLLFRSVSLRKTWHNQLEKKLRNDTINENEILDLKENLVNFMNTEISYNVKRLLPADLQIIFSYNSIDIDTNGLKNPFDEDYIITKNYKVGGINVTDYLIYDCLEAEEWDSAIEQQIIEDPLDCSKCQQLYLGCDMLKIFHHENFCTVKIKSEEPEVKEINAKPNSKLFHCELCNCKLYLTPIEILKHKKSCK